MFRASQIVRENVYHLSETEFQQEDVRLVCRLLGEKPSEEREESYQKLLTFSRNMGLMASTET